MLSLIKQNQPFDFIIWKPYSESISQLQLQELSNVYFVKFNHVVIDIYI